MWVDEVMSMIYKNTIEMNGQRFSVSYKTEKKIVWASTYVNGREIKKHGDDYQTAYWALEQAVYQVLNFRL